MFCPYKRFPNLKDLMVGVYLYSIKPLKEIDQHPGRGVCMKRIYSCKNSVDHISSFECFATKKRIKNQKISHVQHTKYDLSTILLKMRQMCCGVN